MGIKVSMELTEDGKSAIVVITSPDRKLFVQEVIAGLEEVNKRMQAILEESEDDVQN